MEHSPKHKELAEQLAEWWSTQTKFPTKKALAEQLQVHPDTLGDYFSGRKFPRPDIAAKLGQATRIASLKAVTPQEPEPTPARSPDVTASKPPTGPPPRAERYNENAAVISLERSSCPFCSHDIARFQGCPNCGQHFVWANVPMQTT